MILFKEILKLSIICSFCFNSFAENRIEQTKGIVDINCLLMKNTITSDEIKAKLNKQKIKPKYFDKTLYEILKVICSKSKLKLKMVGIYASSYEDPQQYSIEITEDIGIYDALECLARVYWKKLKIIQLKDKYFIVFNNFNLCDGYDIEVVIANNLLFKNLGIVKNKKFSDLKPYLKKYNLKALNNSSSSIIYDNRANHFLIKLLNNSREEMNEVVNFLEFFKRPVNFDKLVANNRLLKSPPVANMTFTFNNIKLKVANSALTISNDDIDMFEDNNLIFNSFVFDHCTIKKALDSFVGFTIISDNNNLSEKYVSFNRKNIKYNNALQMMLTVTDYNYLLINDQINMLQQQSIVLFNSSAIEKLNFPIIKSMQISDKFLVKLGYGKLNGKFDITEWFKKKKIIVDPHSKVFFCNDCEVRGDFLIFIGKNETDWKAIKGAVRFMTVNN